MLRFLLTMLVTTPCIYALKLSGVTKPTGFFDPLGLSNERTDSQLLWLREAELKHSRWGMLGCVGIPAYELVSGQTGIHALDSSSPFFTMLLVGLAAPAEFQSMLNGWESPFVGTNNFFTIKSDYTPGELGFKINKDFNKLDQEFMENAELNHGRIAMISALGMIVQELVTNKPLF